MADALCGPSNPLQSLQKHTQVDRTLQQDRLVGARHSPAQGFRTADPRAGSLDADFHAFENATPSPFQFQQPEFANAFPTFRPASQPSMGGWATDFQNLSINEQPVPAQQFRTEAPLVRSTVGGWHNEFMRQRSSASTPISQGKQAMREPQVNNYAPTMMNYSQPMYGQYSGMYQDSGFQQQQQQQHGPMLMEQQVQISDVDFEAAFADAFAHAEIMDQAKQELQQPPPESLQQQQQPFDPAETIKIGSDAIQYREWKDRTADQDTRDADELARTAGQLLTSVQHDTSTKFQNSNFLDLMRRIRDREVEVQNNDLTNVATGDRAATSGTSETQGLGFDNMASQAHASSAGGAQQQGAEQTSHFAFPDMDAVYAPGADDLDSMAVPEPRVHARSPYTTYGFDDDRDQMHALHPGGKYYPDQSPRLRRAEMETEMSGAVADSEGGDGAPLNRTISVSDFEYVDESAGLARRYRELR